MAVLSACTRPSFLGVPDSPAPVAERPAASADAPVVGRDLAPATPADDTAAPGPTAEEATEAIDLWRQIGHELTMRLPPRHRYGDPVRHLGYSRRHFAAATARSAPYLHFIYHELRRRELPAEIALIPLIESGYDNSARSAGGTAGLWQFIPGTGRRFGLSQSPAYDGRHDVVAATRAALDYFELLARRFDGDWLLAFAAYNCGERNVEQAIARNRHLGRPTDFWSLQLPSITRHYIPRLLALAEVIRDPGAYQVRLAAVPDRPYFEPIEVETAVELRLLAQHSGLPREEFERLNAAYRQRATLRDRVNAVLVAAGRAAGATARLAELPPAALAPVAVHGGGDSHVVRRGDSLWTIARRYGTTSRALADANGLALTSTLRIGQQIRLPGAGRAAPAPARAPRADAAAPEVAAAVPQAHGAVTHYEVQRGDSLWTIARRFKVSIASLRLWNGHAADGVLQPGERLVVHRAPHDDARDI